jgi:PAS domain S-box-containing protein
MVEDSEDDAELIVRELRRGGIAPHWVRVDTPDAMREALDEPWDVVISDYRLPGFSGLQALRLLKERGLDIPFILASGVIGEEVAVEAMRAGADDYVMKRNLARLLPAIARELREAEVRRHRRQAEEALQRQLLFTRALSESIGESVCAIDRRGRLTFVNPACQRMLGWDESELVGRELHDIVHPRGRSCAGECPILEVIRSQTSYHSEDELVRRKDGASVPVALTASPLSDGSRQGAVIAFQDITERKRRIETEQFLAQANESLAELLDYQRTLQRVASLCVPALADVCAVVVAADDNAFSRVVLGLPPGVDELTRTLHPIDAAAQPFVAPAAVVEGNEVAPPELLAFVCGSSDGCALLEERGPFSSLTVALRSRGRIIGSLVLLAGPERSPPDASLAHELAHRAAMAIDNARLYHDVQQAVRVRDEFLSIASHELRTPLTPLRLQIHDLLDRSRSAKLLSQPPDRITARLESASRQVDRMARMVSNLLDVSRIVAGRVVLEREEMDLLALVREVLERAEPELQRGNYQVSLQGAEPIVGNWDRLRVDQAVTNLISNAIKYGEGRPIDAAVLQEGDRALFRVRDHGIGIESDQLDRIFGRFERAVSERAYGGLGLGLYIVRRFAEAHGGAVRVDSRPGEGSTFTLELPLG